MTSLSFFGLLSADTDTEMEDASPVCSPPRTEIPLTFDFELELDELDSITSMDTDQQTDTDDLELRSPRTPIYQGSPSLDSPFDADRFVNFPLLSPSQERSPLAALIYSPAAKSHSDLHQHCLRLGSDSGTKENESPITPSPILPPPKPPLRWIWTCHLCQSRYPLGATRRCLVDGHFYCSGDNSQIGAANRNVKRKKRGHACSSEFDYVGWQDWASWKRDVVCLTRQAGAGAAAIRPLPSSLRGCKACEYPSQCRFQRMNKVPDVVAAVAKRAELSGGSGAKQEVKAIEGMDTKVSKHKDKRKHLKVDTGLLFGRRAKSKDKTCNAIEAETVLAVRPEGTASLDSERHKSLHIRDSGRAAKFCSPLPPDLADFSLFVTDSDTAKQYTSVEGSGVLKPMLADHDVEEASTTGNTADEKSVANTSSSTGAAVSSIGLSTLTRSKSKSRSDEEAGLKQSRINDFFGTTR